MLLSRDVIATLVPHRGAMCLLHEVIDYDDEGIVCRAVNQRDNSQPLREAGMLPAFCGIEYAAQAMAVHGALAAGAARGGSGMLAAVRDLAFDVTRLDDIAGDLIVSARKLTGESGRWLYEFALSAGTRELMRGRAAVVLGPEVVP
jgi:predicted hotdog family 3-hydroxylacyl-ACP dehydratase